MTSNSTIFGRRLSNGAMIRTGKPATTTKLINPSFLWAVDDTGGGHGELQAPTDVAFLPNRNVVVSELMNQRLQIFDISGKPLFTIGEKELKPKGVTVDKSGSTPKIAVVDQNDKTVKFYNLDGVYAGSWKSGLFGNPLGIIITDSGDYIVTDDHPNHPKVCVLTPEGQIQRSFGSHTVSSKEDFIAAPNYVAADNFNRIIITDHTQSSIKVFHTQGHYITSIKGLSHPNGVVAGATDNILVAEGGDNTVCLYSIGSGKLVQQVLTDQDITNPQGLAASSIGFMAVTQNGNETNGLKVYQV